MDYDADTGIAVWKWRRDVPDRVNTRWAGKPVGGLDKQGYLVVGIRYRSYKLHRIIWLIQTGEWPPEDVDHCNRIAGDNRWCNLREATRSENSANSRARRSGPKGVTWYAARRKWRAQIRKDGVNHWLGDHKTEEGAHAAYKAAAERLFGEFGRAA